MSNLFHLAIPVQDLAQARAFYGGVLGCLEGRSSDSWIDFNFYGHQLVAHRVDARTPALGEGHVDGVPVPIPHFGLMMSMADFEELAERIRAAGTSFLIEPSIRYAGKPGEQATMFLLDPSGNALEFKAYAHPEHIFTRN